MNKHKHPLLSLFILSIVLFSSVHAYAYDKNLGIQWGDRVEIACERYIDGRLKTVYSENYPLEVAIDEEITNYNFVSQLVGMKVGEKKDSISWQVTQTNGTVSHFEYRNVLILRITLDSTPDTNGPTAGNIFLTVLKVLGGIGGAVVLAFFGYKIWKKISVKKCLKCGINTAKKKCVKCGHVFCDECTGNGCPNCKSRSFIRL